MPDAFINPNPVLLVLFILYVFCFLVQVVFYWAVFFRVSLIRDPGSGIRDIVTPDRVSHISDHTTGVSVVICAHNEYRQLQRNLPIILEQDYPLFEVVVVDHASDDDTSILLSELGEKYKHLKVVSIQHDLNFFTGKKFPLSIGIKSAKHEIILLTDADCRPAGNQWVRLMQKAFTDDKDIILGYGPYEIRKGLLNALIRFETIQVAVQYLSFAMAGIPYMGVGRNLAYRKRLFYQEKGFISHYRINSGDDDLFINRVAHKKNTGVQRDPGSFTYSEPKESLGKWLTQKRRHMTTGTHYRFIHKFLLGLFGFSQLLFWVLLIWLLALKFAWIIDLSILLLLWISQYIVIGRSMKRLREKHLIGWIPLLELMTLALRIVITGTNFIVKPRKWK
jgi:glycosyltransferase involved in cell wall biosynthesis